MEHPGVEIKGFPTLLFFPAGKKSEAPLKYEGPREINNFIEYLKEHSTKPFEVEMEAEAAEEEDEEDDEEEVKDEL